jgi:hypothetical protein
MASTPIGRESAAVTMAAKSPPMPAVARILARYDRPSLEAFIAIAIDLADTMDVPTDPDEPDFTPRSDGMPGDPLDHEPPGDENDAAWVEWHALRGSQKHGPNMNVGEEDDERGGDEHDHDGTEDDNPYIGTRAMQRSHCGDGAGCPISEPGGDEHDGQEDDGARIPSYGIDHTKNPEPLQDSEDRELMRPHMKRIRGTRCDRLEYGGTNGGYRAVEYRLRDAGEQPPARA